MMITSLDQVSENKLCWPESKPRAARRARNGQFRRVEVGKAHGEIDEEMRKWHLKNYIVSRNHQRIFAGDPGAAVWWLTKREPRELRVLACDKWDTLAARTKWNMAVSPLWPSCETTCRKNGDAR